MLQPIYMFGSPSCEGNSSRIGARHLKTAIERTEVIVDIGGLPIRLCCDDSRFLGMVRERYAGYVTSASKPKFEFEIELAEVNSESLDDDVQVTWDSGHWHMSRGDFRAEFDPSTLRG